MAEVTLPVEEPKVHYVYGLYRDAACTQIFYVGKGYGGRWKKHERLARRASGNPHKNRIINLVVAELGHLPKKKFIEGISDADACALEKAYIAMYGRYPNGPLTNGTDGGEGISGFKAPLELRQRQSAARKGRKLSLEWRAALSEARLRVPLDERIAWAKKMLEAARARTVTDEERAKRSAWQKGVPKSAEHRAKISVALTGRPCLEIVRQKLTGRPIGEERAKALHDSWRGSHHTEEAKQKIAAKQKGVPRLYSRQPRSPEHAAILRVCNIGRKRTPEQVERIRQGALNRKKKTLTECSS
jgi:hypothetical protein